MTARNINDYYEEHSTQFDKDEPPSVGKTFHQAQKGLDTEPAYTPGEEKWVVAKIEDALNLLEEATAAVDLRKTHLEQREFNYLADPVSTFRIAAIRIWLQKMQEHIGEVENLSIHYGQLEKKINEFFSS